MQAVSQPHISCIHAEDAGPKQDAEVIFYNRDKSYGFLRVQGYSYDLFVFGSEFRRAEIPLPPEENRGEGTRMRCRVGKDRRGKPWAVDLEYR